MKKSYIAAAVVSVLLVGCLGFAGCGSKSEPSSTDNGAAKTESASAEDTTAKDEPSPYTVKIGKMKIVKDYTKKKIALVEYTWTNGGDKAQEFALAVKDQAFQDGVELELGYYNEGKYDTAKSFKEIKPGKTQTVYRAYKIDGNKDIEIEVRELMSMENTLLASKTFTLK